MYNARVPNEGFRFTRARIVALFAGVTVALAIVSLPTPLSNFGEFGNRPAIAAAVTALMSIWWLSEALPIYVTACVPLIVYPFTDVFAPERLANAGRTVLPYFDAYNFLFLGGMCIASAMQQWGLHRRIALAIMRAIGTGPKQLLAGVLIGTAFVSLWISNSATATMMVPIGLAIVLQLESRLGGRRLEHYGASLMLAIAYASNVGGIGTKIGTAPNAQFAGFMAQRGVEVAFLPFMAVGLPFVIMFLPVVWLALWRTGRHDAPPADTGSEAVEHEWRTLGRMQHGEWVVLLVFLAAVALWIASKPFVDALRPHVTAFRLASAHVEAGIAMAAALVLALWPVGRRRALDAKSLRLVPWETLLLLGGSFAMAAAIDASGLSKWLAEQLSAVRNAPPFTQMLIACFATVTLSAFASNIATVAVMLNVLAYSVSPAHANRILFGATVAASCDFALPAGTPPNAIVFGTGYVSIPRMAKTGVSLDAAAAVIAAAWCWIAVGWVLG
jgi:sodium-dependent dicarboxylate transporter 2/3/5